MSSSVKSQCVFNADLKSTHDVDARSKTSSSSSFPELDDERIDVVVRGFRYRGFVPRRTRRKRFDDSDVVEKCETF
jgi:hypothetical protein